MQNLQTPEVLHLSAIGLATAEATPLQEDDHITEAALASYNP
jgi:hypothetical protein